MAAGAVRSGLAADVAAKRAGFAELFAGASGLSGRRAEPAESMTDYQVSTSAGAVPVRVYRPQPGRS